MSRSIGDKIASEIGITWRPSVNSLELKFKEKCILVTGSDGLFDVFKDKEIIDYIKRLLSKYYI